MNHRERQLREIAIYYQAIAENNAAIANAERTAHCPSRARVAEYEGYARIAYARAQDVIAELARSRTSPAPSTPALE